MTEENNIPYHQRRLLRKNGLEAQLPTRKEKKPLAKISKKKAQEIADEKAAGTKKVSKLELDKWFFDIQEKYKNGTACMNCGDWIYAQFIRHATAHLLPKKIFKSVANHPLNYLILGAGCGCHEKTHRVDKFIQMKIWPEAARRIKEMIPLLPVDELRHISNQLMMALDKTN